MGRNGGYSRNRDYRLPQNGFADRNGGVTTGGGGGGSSDSSARGQPPVDHPMKENSSEVSGMISGLEKRVAGVQQDFTSAIHKISEKENEKFDLIFAILSELQQRQAHLEESVRSLKAQYGNGQQCMVPNGNGQMQQPQQQPQFGSSGGPNQSYGQMNGQMGGQMNGGNMGGNQQPMQQFAGVMQPDGTQAMFTQVMQPQQMIIMSPPGNGGMQYAAVPQMMTPQGTVVQQMPPQMAMQFIAQSNTQQDMSNIAFVNGQDGCQAQGGSIQAQMNMIKSDTPWEGGNAVNGQPQQEGTEAQGQNSAMSGIGSSETSSQEGKLDDGSPCPALPTATTP